MAPHRRADGQPCPPATEWPPAAAPAAAAARARGSAMTGHRLHGPARPAARFTPPIFCVARLRQMMQSTAAGCEPWGRAPRVAPDFDVAPGSCRKALCGTQVQTVFACALSVQLFFSCVLNLLFCAIRSVKQSDRSETGVSTHGVGHTHTHTTHSSQRK